MTTIAIGSTTTGAPGTNAIVTNSGTALSAILNFTIPRGASGADGRSFTISGLYPTYADMVTANPNPTAGEAHFVGTTDENTVWFWDTDKEPANWTDAGPLKGLKGDPGTNGAAATVNIGSVTIGTPVSVTNSGTANAAILDIVLPPGTASDWFYLRRNNATYVAGDIAYSLLLPSWLCLQCTHGGTTGATEPNYVAKAGTYVNDGTAIWIIKVVNGWQSYSTTEQVVGTWIDGKPLYQKTFTCTTPATANTETDVIDVTSLNISVCADIQGMIYNPTYENYVVWTGSLASGDYLFYNNTRKAIVGKLVSSNYLNEPAYVTLKYTKTTD